jgi:hypothetical protein
MMINAKPELIGLATMPEKYRMDALRESMEAFGIKEPGALERLSKMIGEVELPKMSMADMAKETKGIIGRRAMTEEELGRYAAMDNAARSAKLQREFPGRQGEELDAYISRYVSPSMEPPKAAPSLLKPALPGTPVVPAAEPALRAAGITDPLRNTDTFVNEVKRSLANVPPSPVGNDKFYIADKCFQANHRRQR